MKKSGFLRCLSAAALLLLPTGCSEIQVSTPREAVRRPLGTGAPFVRGTPKAEVLAAWGQPDHVVAHGKDELGNVREEWIYYGRWENIPVDYEYVSRTKHLFFEGENLVRWSTEEPSPPEQR